MTIKDIARESGYAVGTVSRVLNNNPRVSEDARRKILAVVAQHGYQPNANAKHLKQQVPEGLALIVKGTQNALFADAVAEALRRFDSDFDPVMSDSPDKTLFLCDAVLANVLIMEVTAYTPWKLEERMKIRAELKKTNPDCKIVLVVDENTEKKLADKVRQAKKDGLVDNFIYGSVSSTYLSAVIDAL